jgi:hypothetical protein
LVLTRRSSATFLALFLISGPVSAQTVQLGLAGVVGLSGIGVEIDITVPRLGVFGRTQGSTFSGSNYQVLGPKFYFYGQRNSGFYLSPAWARLRCDDTDLSETSTGCDDRPHNVWILQAGAEIGSKNSSWSLFVDGGRYFGVKDSWGVRAWTGNMGVRFRTRSP